MKAPLCKMPWSALTITGRGQIKPCCQLKTNFGSLHEGVTLSEAFSGAGWRELRQAHLASEDHPACRACLSREELLGKSRRIWFEERFGAELHGPWEESAEPHFVQVDLNLSNRCNLRCRMCGSWGSHRWIEEEKALQEFPELRRESNPAMLREFELSREQIDQILPFLKGTKRIDFKGGEPFLATHHDYVLQRLIEMGRHRDITLHYTTNGTFVRRELLDLLKQFKQVKLVFSLEGTEGLYSYIRGGQFDFARVQRNIQLYDELENVHISFNVAMQIYNLLNLRDLWQTLNSMKLRHGDAQGAFDYTLVVDPPYLSPFVAPQPLRELAIARIQDLPEFDHFRKKLASEPIDEKNWAVFATFTRALDQLRGESLAQVAPELAAFLAEPGPMATHHTRL